MSVTYNKPAGLKYTEMCMFIDENLWKIKNTGEYPELEATIYEYLYHIIYALARKESYFKVFSDYEDFAMYGATETYTSLKNKLLNEGKEIRGKVVVPVKSCLNFIKSVLVPLKVDYQKQSYAFVLDPRLKNQDTSIVEHDLKEHIRSDYRMDIEDNLKEVFNNLPTLVFKEILWKTPYKYDNLMLKKLYISSMLTFISQVTIPNNILNKSSRKSKLWNHKLNAFKNISSEVILWHLDEKYHDYVWFLVVQIKHLFSKEFNEAKSHTELSDEMVDNIMKSAYSTYDTRDED